MSELMYSRLGLHVHCLRMISLAQDPPRGLAFTCGLVSNLKDINDHRWRRLELLISPFESGQIGATWGAPAPEPNHAHGVAFAPPGGFAYSGRKPHVLLAGAVREEPSPSTSVAVSPIQGTCWPVCATCTFEHASPSELLLTYVNLMESYAAVVAHAVVLATFKRPGRRQLDLSTESVTLV